jgi:hypothetical protein
LVVAVLALLVAMAVLAGDEMMVVLAVLGVAW